MKIYYNFKCADKNLMWSENVVASKLEAIGKLNGKKTAWIREDLSIKKCNWLTRLIWTIVAKHFSWMRKHLYRVDLPKSRSLLEQIGKQITPDSKIEKIYKQAVEKFNQIAPNYSVPDEQLAGKMHSKLIEDSKISTFEGKSQDPKLLESHKPITKVSIDIARGNSLKENTPEKCILDLFNNIYPKKSRQTVPGPIDFLKLKMDGENEGMFAYIGPDQGERKLVNEFIGDPEVLFVGEKGGDCCCLRMNHLGKILHLEKWLQAAFSTGRKIVTTRVETSHHCFCAAFDSSGKFKIIDSFSYNSTNIKSLEDTLNQANIKTKEGKKISFQGEKICTGIQNGGHFCMRFATLFAYQIMKDKDIDAYKKVIGAFSQNLLKRFSDLEVIGQATPKENCSNIPDTHYSPFMESWAATICLGHENWQEIPVGKLQCQSVYKIQKNALPGGMKIPLDWLKDDLLRKQYTFEIDDPSAGLSAICDYPESHVGHNLPLKEFIPEKTGETTYVIVTEKSRNKKEIQVIRLQSGIFLKAFWDGIEELTF